MEGGNKMQTWEDIQKRNTEVAKEVMDLCNKMGNERTLEKEFIEVFMNEHNTIRQTFMGMLRRIIIVYSRDDRVDDRNEASVAWARKVVEQDDGFGFPYI
jgi:hypothetical protein